MRLILCLALLVVLEPPRVTIRVTPQVVREGGTVHLTCRVPRAPENRALQMGLNNYRDSQMELDGERASTVYETDYPRVPCDVDAAYCILVEASGRRSVAQANIAVVECHQ